MKETSDYGPFFPHSRKVYVNGSQPGVRVPFREIELAHTINDDGTENRNSPIRVYDTAGPNTEGPPPALRAPWIAGRNHATQLELARAGIGRAGNVHAALVGEVRRHGSAQAQGGGPR